MQRILMPLWFTALEGYFIGRIWPDGHVSEIALPDSDASPSAIAVGAGHRVWFTSEYPPTLKRYDPASHRVTSFALPTNADPAGPPVLGPDGRFWLTDSTSNQLLAVTASGKASAYPLPSGGPYDASTRPDDLVMGADHHLWFLEIGANRLCRVNSPGNVTEYALPPLTGDLAGTPANLVVDHQGSFWYTVSGDASDGDSSPGEGALVHIALAHAQQ
jgi:streptogramin lyase